MTTCIINWQTDSRECLLKFIESKIQIDPSGRTMLRYYYIVNARINVHQGRLPQCHCNMFWFIVCQTNCFVSPQYIVKRYKLCRVCVLYSVDRPGVWSIFEIAIQNPLHCSFQCVKFLINNARTKVKLHILTPLLETLAGHQISIKDDGVRIY